MSLGFTINESLLRRLPLPLAKLYCGAHNAKTPKDRHHCAFYLWEAALKLLGSVAVVDYSELNRQDPQLAERLKNLARPALGHWREFFRLLLPVLAEQGGEAYASIRDLFLATKRVALPEAARLRAELQLILPKSSASPGSALLNALFDDLVQYRNREFGHGAVGQRPDKFYEQMGRTILLAVAEVLDQLDILAGRRLCYVDEVRRLESGDWQIHWSELLGESARRLEPLTLADSASARRLLPNRLYLHAGPVQAEAATSRPAQADPAAAFRLLNPLLIYDAEANDIYFLNAKRGQHRTEYLSYSSGQTVERDDLAIDQRRLLERILGVSVNTEMAVQLATAAIAEDSGEGPAEAPGISEPGEQENLVHKIGEFELLAKLGHGRFGVVYRARQPSLDREVALKCVLPAGNQKVEARFHREIRALGRAEHPNLVKIYSSGAEADKWFYAMELVEGSTLASVSGQLQARCSSASALTLNTWQEAVSTAYAESRQAEKPLSDAPASPVGPMPAATSATDAPGLSTTIAPKPATLTDRNYVRHVVELIQQVAEAAQALHKAGIVHRDIKPGNVMVTADGSQAVLVDLGLAQLVDAVEGSVVRTTQFVGTLRYASPEQLLPAGPLDGRSDVYSIGVMLWELLTLRPMYGASDATPTRKLMEQIEYDEPERVRKYHPGIASDLDAIVLKCLQKRPDHRYATAGELAADLACWLRGDPVAVHPPTLTYIFSKYVRRHRLRLAVAGAFTVAVLAGLTALITGLTLVRINQARDQMEKAYQDAEASRLVAEQAQREAEQARAGEQTQRRQAEAFAQEARDQAVRLDVATGVRLLDTGDALGALGWFADALKLDRGDPAREEMHRLRLASIWHQCPRIGHMWLHTGPVTCGAWSPDDRFVVTAGPDAIARVWDVATGQVRELRHEGRVKYVALSPDGKRLVTAGDANSASVWSASGERLATLAHQGAVRHAAFSADGLRIVTASADKTARVWELVEGESGAGPKRAREWQARQICAPLKHMGAVLHAEFSPDGGRVVTASEDKTARIWNTLTGQVLVGPLVHEDAVFQASFSANGNLVLTADAGVAKRGGGLADFDDEPSVINARSAYVWNAATGQQVVHFQDHQGPITDATFSPDGLRVVTASADKTARVWDALTGKLIAPPFRHGDVVNQVRFSPDGQWLVTASRDNTAWLWEVNSGWQLTLPLRHSGEVLSASFSHDGLRVVTVSTDKTARIWEVARSTLYQTRLRHEASVRTAVFSPDGRKVLTASTDKTARIWTLDTGLPGSLVLTHQNQVNDAAFSSDGRFVVTASDDKGVRVWDAVSGHLAWERKHGDAVLHAAFSLDNRRVVSAGRDRTARVWEAETGRPLSPPLKHDGPVNHAAFSPDGRLVVTAARGDARSPGLASLWDAESGKPRGKPIAHGQQVTWASFSPDGQRLITASDDGTARIWNALTGEAATRPLQHGRTVLCAMFNALGTRVVTASRDRTARVWDAATGEPVTPPLKHRGEVSVAFFSPDGRKVITADLHLVEAVRGEARVWDAETGEPVTPVLEHEAHVPYASFSPDGRRFVTACEDGTATIWDLFSQPQADRGWAEWVEQAQVLSGQQIHVSRGFLPLPVADVYRKWQALDKHNTTEQQLPPQQVLSWHPRQAETFEAGQQWFAAKWHLDHVVAAEPKAAKGYERRANASAKLGEWKEAYADYTQALELDPENWRLLFQRGKAREQLGDLDHAIEDYSKALAWEPGEPGNILLLTARGAAYVEQGEHDKAMLDYSNAKERKPIEPAHLADLAKLHQRVLGMVRSYFRSVGTNARPGFSVQLNLDHASGHYRDKEAVQIQVHSERDGFLYLLYRDASDQVYCLFPNKGQQDPRIRAKQTFLFPAKDMPFQLRVHPPQGLESLQAIVTQEPVKNIPFDQFAEDGRIILGSGQEAINRLRTFQANLHKHKHGWSGQLRDFSTGSRTVAAIIDINPKGEVWAAKEAQALVEAWKVLAGMPEPIVLVNRQANLKNIEELLTKKIPTITNPGDMVILHWSGPGAVRPNGEAAGLPTFYLATANSEKDAQISHLLRGTTLAGWLQALDGRQVRVILDTDYAAGIAESIRTPSTHVLAACQAGQHAYERGDFGVFNFYLIEFLKTRSQNTFSLQEAYEYVKDRVPTLVRKIDAGVQVPALFQ